MNGWMHITAGLLLGTGILGAGGAMLACRAWNATARFVRWAALTLVVSAVATGLVVTVIGPLAGADLQARVINTFPFVLSGCALLGLLMTTGRLLTSRRPQRAMQMAFVLWIPVKLACMPLVGWVFYASTGQGQFAMLLSAMLILTIQVVMALGIVMIALAVTRDDGRAGLWFFVSLMVQAFLMVVGLIVLGLLMMTHDQAGPLVARWLGLDPQLQDWSLGSLMMRWLGLHAAMVAVGVVAGVLTLLFWPEGGHKEESISARRFWLGEPSADAALPARPARPRMPAPVIEPHLQTQPMVERGAAPVVEIETVDVPVEPAISPAAPQASTHAHAGAPRRVSHSQIASLPPMDESLEGAFPTSIHYVVMAFIAAVFVFYASLIPMEYQPLLLEDAIRRFRHVKFYELGIDRRADLLANLVVIVPVTFLMMGALHRSGAGVIRLAFNSLITALLAGVYVVAIEFTQEWFPPRTISQNDMQAGAAGALAGIILWLTFGEHVTYALKQAFLRQGSALSLRLTLWLYVVALAGYLMFPMDFTMDPDLIRLKMEQGRIAIWPWAQEGASLRNMALTFVRNIVLFVPIGLLMSSPWPGRQPSRMAQVMGVIGLAVLLELIRLPVFSSHNGSVHLIGRVIGGFLGLLLAGYVLDEAGRLSLGRSWSTSSRRWLGLAGALAVAIAASLVLLYPFKFDVGPEIFQRKLQLFFNWPFKHYYWAGEWTALTKVVACMGLFAGVGVLMRWGWNTTISRQRQGLVLTLLLVLVVGAAVEIAQAASGQRVVHTMSLDRGLPVGLQEQALDITDNSISKGMLFSIGKVSDITDLLAYLTGAWLGWVVVGMILPREKEDTQATDDLSETTARLEPGM